MALIDWVLRSFYEAVVRFRRLCSLITGVCCGLVLMGGWATGHEPVGAQAKQAGVAAGFGYQNETGATMTVKVYDAVSGKVLSEDVYELIVEEDPGARSEGSTLRIFAGGAGGTSDDLSSFLLRAYDGKTGEFQWVGRLHFNPMERGGDERAIDISTSMVRRAALRTIGGPVRSEDSYPLFILRGWDPFTGVLHWEDEFSPDEDVAASVGIPVVHATARERSWAEWGVIDFQILMVDRRKGSVLWEDRAFQWMDQELPVSPNDHAQRMPDRMGPSDAGSSMKDM